MSENIGLVELYELVQETDYEDLFDLQKKYNHWTDEYKIIEIEITHRQEIYF